MGFGRSVEVGDTTRPMLIRLSGRVEVVLDHGHGVGFVEVESFAIDFVLARLSAGGRRSWAA